MDVQDESARRMSACVTALLRQQPFFGSLALRLPLRADAGRETLASDGKEILYSPQWIAGTDAHLISAAMARAILPRPAGNRAMTMILTRPASPKITAATPAHPMMIRGEMAKTRSRLGAELRPVRHRRGHGCARLGRR